MMEVIILLFTTSIVKAIVNLMTHSKYVNVVVEPVMGCSDDVAMAISYGVLKPRRSRIDVCLINHSTKQITLPKQSAMGGFAAANIIPALLMPKPLQHESGKGEAITQKGKVRVKKNFWTKLTKQV